MRLKLLLTVIFECMLVLLCIKLFGQGSVQLTPGARLKSTAGSFMVMNNMHLTNNGAIQYSIGDGTIKFAGTNNVQFSGSGVSMLDKLQLDQTGNGQLMLQTDLTVAGEIIFTNGLLNLSNHFVDLGTTGVLTGEAESSHAITQDIGYIQATNTLNAPSGNNPGNLGAMISSPQNLGLVVIRRGHKVQSGSGLSASIARYYDISAANNTNLNAAFRFYYLNAELNNLDEATLQFYSSDDQVTWTSQGFDNRSITQNYVEKNSLPHFSRWTLSSTGVALPVTGLLLTGNWQNGYAHLHWSTQAEYNNDYFDIERKYADENLFIQVGRQYTVNPGGNSQALSIYSRTDSSSRGNRGPILYRLKQFDRDGHYIFSNTISIRPGLSKIFIEDVYPTILTDNRLYVETGNMNLKNMKYKIFDSQGKLYLDQDIEYHSKWLQTPYLPDGVYHIIFTSGEQLFQKTVVRQ